MIKPNELRIGNYYIFEGRTDQITNGWQISFIRQVIMPIHLNEEWLLKFGFIHDSIAWNLDCLILDKSMEGYAVFIHGLHYGRTTNIKYVHQLQNLFFALTGIELTIKENVK